MRSSWRRHATYSQIAVVSGKGGTGKTTVCAAFAAISKNSVLADCDVDAPDLHILLQPRIIEEIPFSGSEVAVIDKEVCTLCGLCEKRCRFGAAHPPRIDVVACEGCAVCEYVCPVDAVIMKPRISGNIYASTTRFGPMSHARLLAGEGNSGRLVTEVRKRASKMALEQRLSTILIDGSPGIGCPVIATLTGVDLAVIVTEPTLTGAHDMQRVLELCSRLDVGTAVIINKYDINPDMTEQIKRHCTESGVYVLGRIPFDSVMTRSMMALQTIPEFAPASEIALLMKDMWDLILDLASE